jgi:hypothetical protein
MTSVFEMIQVRDMDKDYPSCGLQSHDGYSQHYGFHIKFLIIKRQVLVPREHTVQLFINDWLFSNYNILVAHPQSHTPIMSSVR